MALLSCPECGHTVSSEADSCPHCGYPIAANFNIDTIVEALELKLERIRLKHAAFRYIDANAPTRNAMPIDTGFSEQQLTNTPGQFASYRGAIAVRECIRSTCSLFESSGLSHCDIFRFILAVSELISQDRYNTPCYGIFNDGLSHIYTAKCLLVESLSENEIMQIQAVILPSFSKDKYRGNLRALYEVFASRVSDNNKHILLHNLSAASEEALSLDPFFC